MTNIEDVKYWQIFTHNKVAVDLILNSHNEYLRILKLASYLRIFMNVIKSKVTNTRSIGLSPANFVIAKRKKYQRHGTEAWADRAKT